MMDCFFYGLFMDPDVLREAGVAAGNPRSAVLDGYALRIGKRATMVRDDLGRAYGMVYSISEGDLNKLYSAPGLEIYRPETVRVSILDGEVIEVACYLLPAAPDPSERNEAYAAKLREVLQKLGFPVE